MTWNKDTLLCYVLTRRRDNEYRIMPQQIEAVYSSRESLEAAHPEINFRWVDYRDSSLIAAFAGDDIDGWVVLERAII